MALLKKGEKHPLIVISILTYSCEKCNCTATVKEDSKDIPSICSECGGKMLLSSSYSSSEK